VCTLKDAASQALSETLLLITPCDDLYISSARMLQKSNNNIHSLLAILSTIPAANFSTNDNIDEASSYLAVLEYINAITIGEPIARY
jgi:hypothetical protein